MKFSKASGQKEPLVLIRFIALLLLLITTAPGYSSHYNGGEISYKHLGGTNYLVQVKALTSCGGIGPTTSMTVDYTSVSCGLSGQVTLPLNNYISTPDICPSLASQNSCNSGSGPLDGYYLSTYQGSLILPKNCDDWVFSTQVCCRNYSDNLNNYPGGDYYIYSTLDNLNFTGNNSPVFPDVPNIYLSPNQLNSVNWGGFDPDGDSLVYMLEPVTAMTNQNGLVLANYHPGYTYLQPYQSVQPTLLDSTTGILDAFPNANQLCNIAFKVLEFRNGTLIGTTYREYITLIDATVNTTPTIQVANQSGSNAHHICGGDSLKFNITISDPDPGTHFTYTLDSNSTSASIITLAPDNSLLEFNWATDISEVRSAPYLFYLTATDDNCTYASSSTMVIPVYVNGCNTDNVWPGDANSDGIVDLSDLLTLGLTYGNSGPVRQAASLSWTGQMAVNWLGVLPTGVNYKHSDTNGDGTIDLDDTTAVILNQGLNHPLKQSGAQPQGSIDLMLTTVLDTVGPGSFLEITADLSGSPTDSLYGLYFQIAFDPAMIAPGTMTYDFSNSIFGTSQVDMIHLELADPSIGLLDLAITSIDHINKVANGEVVKIILQVSPGITLPEQLDLNITPVRSYNAAADPLSLNSTGTTVHIDPFSTGVLEQTDAGSLWVSYLEGGSISIKSAERIEFDDVKLVNLQGQVVFQENYMNTDQKIDLNRFSKGIYVLSVSEGLKTTLLKVINR